MTIRDGTYIRDPLSDLGFTPTRSEKRISGGGRCSDPDPDLDFTDSVDPDTDPDNEILGLDIRIRIRTYYLFKIFKI